MKIRKSYIATAIAAMATMSLVACAPGESEIRGGAKSGINQPTTAPEEGPGESNPELAEPIAPVEKGEVGDMPAAIDPEDVDVEEVMLPGFSDEQLKDAAAWAATFTRSRFTRSGLWVTGSDQADPLSPVTYYVFVSQMAPETQSEIAPKILGKDEVEKNLEFLSGLVPQPPAIEGKWMVPAVGNFVFGQPVFSPGNYGAKSVNVGIPYAAYAVYGDEARGEYWAIEVTDKVAYTLVSTRDGWKVADWKSNVSFGEAKRLKGAPGDRFFATIPEQLAGKR